ncbi:MAG: aminoacyl--tRNA ligase-related protein [Acidimicrobiales bacterium]
MVAGEILDEAELPLRLMAHTSCFRREAGSAGRDTRGLLRVHEFDKVELYAFCTPEQAPAMHEEILGRAEAAIRDLGLAHRVLDLACGDISGAGARTFDIEVFAPGPTGGSRCRRCRGVPITRPVGPTSATALPGRRARSSSTASTVRGSRYRGCGRPSWRRTAGPTVRCGCPRCCCRTSAA